MDLLSWETKIKNECLTENWEKVKHNRKIYFKTTEKN